VSECFDQQTPSVSILDAKEHKVATLGQACIETALGIAAPSFPLDRVDTSVLQELLEHGASPNEAYNGDG
jgi:hypothetical protein